MLPEPTTGRPLRIGVWCDYGFTLEPTQGVGVFTFNLVAGLLQLDEPLEVVMLVGPKDQHVAADLLRQANGRLRIVPDPMTRDWRLPPAVLWGNWIRGSDGLHAFKWAFQKHLTGLVHSWSQQGRQGLSVTWSAVRQRSLPALALLAIGLVAVPVIGMLAWALFAAGRLLLAASRALLFPLRLFDRLVRGLRVPPPDPRVTQDEAGCDVWLIPYVGLEYPITVPAIVVIHDLVYVHFPDTFADPAITRRLDQLVHQRASEATLVACLSDFIRGNDLQGVLQLPDEKVRVVRAASPQDFPIITAEQEMSLLPPGLDRPYLFYPAGFRPYKNHRALIQALQLLRDRFGVDDFDLVFTGYRPLPDDLRRQVFDSGLSGRVHALECVERGALAALYRNAFATIVPTLYEQGSFPVYEALHYGCPVACSRIPALREQCRDMGDAMLYFDPHNAEDIARTVLAIRDNRESIRATQAEASRPLFGRTWKDAAMDWLRVFRETVLVAKWQSQLDTHLVEPWPRPASVPAEPRSRREAFLFLHKVYTGGVWETTKDLVRDLVAVNRERGQLTLTLGLHENQVDTRPLERLGHDLPVQWLRLNPIARDAAEQMLGGAPHWLRARPEKEFSFLSGAALTALRADAWLALVDRFPLPLLPARPYGVVVYDMIQRRVPETFDETFFQTATRGMAPTARGADLVLVTTPQTRADVIAEYGLDPEKVRLVPVACNPERRFGHLTAQRVDRVREPFLLNVTNAALHKGAEVLLRGQARLKGRLGSRCPQLVLCGWDSQHFAAGSKGSMSHWLRMRQLVTDLALQEGQDVAFLGFVTDAELMDLYHRCHVVVNAALYDNGSFSLLEAAWFGRRAVSSRYPAVEYLCQRFGVPPRMFESGNAEDLAGCLAAALNDPPPTAADRSRTRERLRDPEFSTHRYAERVYEALVELAEMTDFRQSPQREQVAQPSPR